MTLAQPSRFAQGMELGAQLRPGGTDKGSERAVKNASRAVTGPKSMPFFTAKPFLKLPLAALLPALISASCGSESETATASCVPGRTEACACAGGRIGVQRCRDGGAFGPCDCSGSGGPDAGAGGSTSSDGGASVDGGDNMSPAVREFCDRTIRAFAEKAASCCSEADRGAAQFASLDGDRHAMATECVPLIGNAIASGRIRFDSDRAASCSAAFEAKIENLSCSSPEARALSLWDSTVCDGVILGLQDVDQPCQRPSECRPGLACVGYAKDAEGSCRALPGGRDPCSRVRTGVIGFPFDTAVPQCAANLRCTQGSADPKPQCYPLRDVGEICDSNARDCKLGLRCTEDRACMPYQAVGETCNGPFSCAPGFTCNAARKCVEGVDGAPCSFDENCSGRCVTGPDLKGTCRAFCGSR